MQATIGKQEAKGRLAGVPTEPSRDNERRRPPLPLTPEEAAETAWVVGYRPGLGSLISREE